MRRAILALILAGLPVPAMAGGWYLDAAGAYAILQNSDLSDGRLPGAQGELSADDGFGVTGAVGYRFDNGLRTEAEIGYRNNGLDSISGGGFGTIATGGFGGDVTALSGMLNLIYDYAKTGPVTPYIGGGLGAASINIDSTALGVDASDTVFAYQFMAGLRYPLTDQLSLRAGYRFFHAMEPEIQGTKGEYLSHNLEIGFTLGF